MIHTLGTEIRGTAYDTDIDLAQARVQNHPGEYTPFFNLSAIRKDVLTAATVTNTRRATRIAGDNRASTFGSNRAVSGELPAEAH
jgi:hypothetical protein